MCKPRGVALTRQQRATAWQILDAHTHTHNTLLPAARQRRSHQREAIRGHRSANCLACKRRHTHTHTHRSGNEVTTGGNGRQRGESSTYLPKRQRAATWR
eukprot:3281552-Pyramimonas_sp.AAC.1